MGQKQQKRLIELYEKGVLTKEEAKACFLEFEETPDVVFVEEKARLAFSLPSLKVFSSSKLKQSYRFDAIDAMKISLTKGKIVFQKHKHADICLSITYPQSTQETLLPQIYVKKKSLHFLSNLPCNLLVSLPEKWMSVLDLEIGEADTRLDYLPFEDISIRSYSDKKQQDVRVNLKSSEAQHVHVALVQAPIHIDLPKVKGIKARFESQTGLIQFNRRQQASPYIYEKGGESVVYLNIETQSSSLSVKGIHHV